MNPIPSLACAATFLCVAVSAAAAPLRVAGSDLFGETLRKALTSEKIELDLTGTLAGREALLAGRADAALLTVAPGAADTVPIGFRGLPVAFVAAVVLVPEANPLTQITFEQLGGIFGSDEALSLRRWGELGLGDAWVARSIVPSALGRRRSLALDLFAQSVLAGRALRPNLSQLDAVDALCDGLEVDPAGIAVAPLLPSNRRSVRALLVARVGGEVAFGPSPENIASGDYPLRLPVLLVFRPERTREVAPLLRFFGSDAGAAAVEASLLVAPPPGARAALAAAAGAG